ncbi:FAD-dependent monooxygenase [Dyadobacter flavalbus]|uniref:FAD-dependent monooxygenase n=1 Tax=Dyadobacter flavalbus TaxID=2579942 RepID=A0A5M8Q9Q8_9BACT|nr:NAD(P)/FAD-dependent oxidoreductase [Dyadobacter flavalbus]KAA6432717.1 FAD-dependent monooxygenase [Dyadobacter flavalbus]
MLLENKQVAIIGGGPGGLTLARLLQQQGCMVKVYERDAGPYVRQQGATLDLHYESGLKALAEAGLMEAFRKNFRPGAERVTITDNHAVIHYTERSEAPVQDLNNENARPEIDRGPLRDLLIASLKDHTVVWNSKFRALEENGNGWNVLFENGTTVYADLVVACDGASSRVRKYITDIARIYSGVTIIEGNIYNAAVHAPRLWELTNGGKVFAHWNGKTIVLSAKGEGSLSFYTITEEPEDLSKTSGIDFTDRVQVFSWFRQRFADWSEDWHEVFSSSDSYFVARPQYYFPKDQSWKTVPNLTVIGDAAHQTPPSGDGVNQAMLDALELYQALCLQDFTTVQEALASYEKEMLSRTSVTTEEASQLMQSMLSDNSFRIMLDFFEKIKA